MVLAQNTPVVLVKLAQNSSSPMLAVKVERWVGSFMIYFREVSYSKNAIEMEKIKPPLCVLHLHFQELLGPRLLEPQDEQRHPLQSVDLSLT